MVSITQAPEGCCVSNDDWLASLLVVDVIEVWYCCFIATSTIVLACDLQNVNMPGQC